MIFRSKCSNTLHPNSATASTNCVPGVSKRSALSTAAWHKPTALVFALLLH
jgi:hypothetical protein